MPAIGTAPFQFSFTVDNARDSRRRAGAGAGGGTFTTFDRHYTWIYTTFDRYSPARTCVKTTVRAGMLTPTARVSVAKTTLMRRSCACDRAGQILVKRWSNAGQMLIEVSVALMRRS